MPPPGAGSGGWRVPRRDQWPIRCPGDGRSAFPAARGLHQAGQVLRTEVGGGDRSESAWSDEEFLGLLLSRGHRGRNARGDADPQAIGLEVLEIPGKQDAAAARLQHAQAAHRHDSFPVHQAMLHAIGHRTGPKGTGHDHPVGVQEELPGHVQLGVVKSGVRRLAVFSHGALRRETRPGFPAVKAS